jgi:hypothetical protein
MNVEAIILAVAGASLKYLFDSCGHKMEIGVQTYIWVAIDPKRAL